MLAVFVYWEKVMYLRPDEVARVLEHAGFTRDSVTDKTYGFYKGEHYVYVNREARMGRTALVIHPDLGEKSRKLAYPAETYRSNPEYRHFPLDPNASTSGPSYLGIPHGFNSRDLLNRYLNTMFPSGQ